MRICPPTGDAQDGFGFADFTIDDSAACILKCPIGRKCSKSVVKDDKQQTISHFDVERCRNFPHAPDCPFSISKRKARLVWEWKRPRIELRRMAFVDDQDMLHFYCQRSGGEATFLLLKGRMGLERIHRRSFAQTKLGVVMPPTALNILLAHQWLRRQGGNGAATPGDNANSAPPTYFFRFCYVIANSRPQFSHRLDKLAP